MREFGTIDVVGGGLAGSECALQLAKRGVRVRLYEQRPVRVSPAHHSDGLAELVCSNSLKSIRHDSAAGLLKEELSRMDSQLLAAAHASAVPAGGALAVDRDAFSARVGEQVGAEPLIELVRAEVTEIPSGRCVIAAGPLCTGALAEALEGLVGGTSLSFYDAASPIVDASTLERSVVFAQSRYEREGTGDYLNCPMGRDEYETFVDALVSARRVVARDFERNELFCACQPIEEVARTGLDAARYGAMKPVGLVDPRNGQRPWAVVQLRPENVAGTAYSLVGFQTNLAWPEQRRVFRMVAGLQSAEFFRYGVMHRNSFVDAPRALDETFKVPNTQVRLAGQITGTEGYSEAIASGLLAALNTYAELADLPAVSLPPTSALGSLVAYATNPSTTPYQPMHANFGLVPPLVGRKLARRERYSAYADRAIRDLSAYLDTRHDLFPDS